MGFEHYEDKYENQDIVLAVYLATQIKESGNELLKKNKSLESLMGVVFKEGESINGAIMRVPDSFNPMDSTSYQKLAEYWITDCPDTLPLVIGISGTTDDNNYVIMLLTSSGHFRFSIYILHRSLLGNRSIGDHIKTIHDPNRNSQVCLSMNVFFHVINDSIKTEKLSSLSGSLLH